MKRVLTLIFAAFTLLTPRAVIAQTNSDLFHTKLRTTVTVSNSGLATIRHDFTITNKTPTTFISQYGLKIGSSELQNITVHSGGQQLQPEIVPTAQQGGPGQTSIGITFPDKIVGEGKNREFSIGYIHPDAAMISGSVLEVSLPAQANPEDYDEYTVTLLTPTKFGPPVRTTPENFTFTTVGDKISTTFSQGAAGIFALYGSTQLFDLDLTFHLENETNNPGITQIALPPDTPYQQMYYQSLEPKPEKLEIDQDGNWIATYKVPANTTTTVVAKATTRLTLEPSGTIPTALPNDELLKSQEFWQVDDEQIKDLAATYATAETINDYVVSTLTYNTKRALNAEIDRLGAIEALRTPDMAVCTEFTDTFVTIARAATIPARRVTGYAYTQNSELRPLSLVDDVLHAWPEYYDYNKKQWIPIDPTWENTTGGVDYFNQRDLNHITFAINGHSSEQPYPAGSYKNESSEDKTVNVTFGTTFPETPFSVQQSITPKKIIGVPLPGVYNLTITNETGRAWYNVPIELETQNSTIVTSKQSGQIAALLPYQTISVPIRLESNLGILGSSDTIRSTINHDSQQFTVTSGPALSKTFREPGVWAIVATICIVVTLGTGSVLVLRRRRQRTVRR